MFKHMYQTARGEILKKREERNRDREDGRKTS